MSNGKADAHGPARLQSYLNASIVNIDRFVTMGFVDCNRLRAEAVDGDLLIAGHLCCQGEIVVEVEKLLEKNSRRATRASGTERLSLADRLRAVAEAVDP